MGVIRWTGKRLKLVGQLLEADEVERWFEDKLKDLAEQMFQDTSVKWFRGRARARKRAIETIQDGDFEVTPLQAYSNGGPAAG